jgi:hypothetical protein
LLFIKDFRKPDNPFTHFVIIYIEKTTSKWVKWNLEAHHDKRRRREARGTRFIGAPTAFTHFICRGRWGLEQLFKSV